MFFVQRQAANSLEKLVNTQVLLTINENFLHESGKSPITVEETMLGPIGM